MAPCQLSRQCLDFLKFDIEKADLKNIRTTKSLSIVERQVFRKTIKELAPIFCFKITFLFKLHDILTNFPVCLNQNGIDSLSCFLPSFQKQSSNLGNQILIISL